MRDLIGAFCYKHISIKKYSKEEFVKSFKQFLDFNNIEYKDYHDCNFIQDIDTIANISPYSKHLIIETVMVQSSSATNRVNTYIIGRNIVS